MDDATTELKNRCPQHGVRYGALEQCGMCEGDPAPAPSSARPAAATPPLGCLAIAEREKALVDVANQANAAVVRLKRRKKKDFHTEIAIKGYLDTQIKALRASHDIAMERESEEALVHRQNDDDGDAH